MATMLNVVEGSLPTPRRGLGRQVLLSSRLLVHDAAIASIIIVITTTTTTTTTITISATPSTNLIQTYGRVRT